MPVLILPHNTRSCEDRNYEPIFNCALTRREIYLLTSSQIYVPRILSATFCFVVPLNLCGGFPNKYLPEVFGVCVYSLTLLNISE